MNDSELNLRQKLRAACDVAEAGRVADFDVVWAGAQAQARGRRRRKQAFGGLAVAATVLMAAHLGLQQPAPPTWEFVDPGQLASSTSWAAPSDVLLPKHAFDLYGEIPVLIESTATDEGALL